MFARFTTVAGERGAADAERDIRGFALKFYTEESNWDMVGNNTPVFFLRDPRKFPDLNKAVKRDPKTNLRSATNNWDFGPYSQKPYIKSPLLCQIAAFLQATAICTVLVVIPIA